MLYPKCMLHSYATSNNYYYFHRKLLVHLLNVVNNKNTKIFISKIRLDKQISLT